MEVKVMYYAVNEKKRCITDDEGNEYTIRQFKVLLKLAAEREEFVDMTQMTQRLTSFDFDFDKLAEFYGD
jgi:hypothetical protein